MNRQQRTLLIALAGTLALVLVIILALTLVRGGADKTQPMPDLPIITATPEPTAPPVSEQELENLALSEEADDHDIVDEYDPEANATTEPID